MFGFKEKRKKPALTEEIKEEIHDIGGQDELSEAGTVEEEKAETAEAVASPEYSGKAAAEPLPTPEQKTDKFDLAHMLGKTESGLKKDFYIYQIKELMSRLGKTVNDKKCTVDGLAETYKELKELGVGEIAVSPFFFREIDEAADKVGKTGIKKGALIDYPNGESSFRARIADVKEAVGRGADTVTVCLSAACVSLIRLSEEKARLYKLARIAKKTFGAGIDANLSEEALKKTLKAVEGLKIARIALLGETTGTAELIDVVKRVSEVKGNKELCVYSNISAVSELSELIDCGADRVFTPYVERIGKELKEKFDVEL